MQYVFGISQKYLPYFLGKMEKLGASKNWQCQASLACIALALPPPNPVASYNAPRRPINCVRVRGCVYIYEKMFMWLYIFIYTYIYTYMYMCECDIVNY